MSLLTYFATLFYNINRFHVGVRLFSNRLQKMLKCGKTMADTLGCTLHVTFFVFSTFWSHLWSITEQYMATWVLHRIFNCILFLRGSIPLIAIKVDLWCIKVIDTLMFYYFCSLPVALLCGFLLGLGDSSFNTQVLSCLMFQTKHGQLFIWQAVVILTFWRSLPVSKGNIQSIPVFKEVPRLNGNCSGLAFGLNVCCVVFMDTLDSSCSDSLCLGV